MAVITLPATPKPASAAWRLVQPAQQNISDWTGRRQVLPSGRGWWECSISMPPIVGSTSAGTWLAFLANTAGTANTFNVPAAIAQQSALTATVLVNGAGQTGKTLATDGWPTSQTVLKAGQFVTVNSQLLQLTADATTNSSGQVTLQFAPSLRLSPADNLAVEYKNPYAVMSLTEDTGYSVDLGAIYSLQFQLREAF